MFHRVKSETITESKDQAPQEQVAQEEVEVQEVVVEEPEIEEVGNKKDENESDQADHCEENIFHKANLAELGAPATKSVTESNRLCEMGGCSFHWGGEDFGINGREGDLSHHVCSRCA